MDRRASEQRQVKYDYAYALWECVRAARNLPEGSPFKPVILQALDHPAVRGATAFQRVLPVEDVFCLPAGTVVELLAAADLSEAISLGLHVSRLDVVNGVRLDFGLATFASAAALVTTSASESAKCLPIVADCPATKAGFLRFPLIMPNAWLADTPYEGREKTDRHATSPAFTWALAGTVTDCHQDYLGGHHLLAALSGFKVFFFWPASDDNIDKLREYWRRDLSLTLLAALDQLSGLQVLVAREPIAFFTDAIHIHAVITLENAVHLGGVIWTAVTTPEALRRVRRIFEVISEPRRRGEEALACGHVLDGWNESEPKFARLLDILRKSALPAGKFASARDDLDAIRAMAGPLSRVNRS